MEPGVQPKGLQNRIKALERRLAALEQALVAIQVSYASGGADDPGRVAAIAGELAAAQVEYDDALLALRELESMARRLRDWGLTPGDTATWASVCRALGRPTLSDAHRTIRSREPVLHVLLHRCAFAPFCAIDGASYQ